MNTSRRRMLALVAGTAALLIAGAEAQQVQKADWPRFVKVGLHRINIDQTMFTRDHGKSLEIYFSGDHSNVVLLTGDEPEAMRRWLDERSPELTASKVIMEGVDINSKGGSTGD